MARKVLERHPSRARHTLSVRSAHRQPCLTNPACQCLLCCTNGDGVLMEGKMERAIGKPGN